MRLTTAIAILASFHGSVAFSGSVAGTGGSTEVTQILNYYELLESKKNLIYSVSNQARQIQHQLNSYQELAKNSKSLSDFEWGQIESQLNNLANLVRQGQALSYSMDNLNQAFTNIFPDYATYIKRHKGTEPEAVSEQYSTWSETNVDTVKASLASANLQNKQFESERATMQTLEHKGQTSKGRLEALQVGNQIAAQQVGQTQKLRQLVMAQMQMQGAYIASRSQKESYSNSYKRDYYSKKAPTFQPGNRY